MAPVPLQPRPTPRSVDLPVVRALRGAGSGTGRLVLPADAAVLVLPEWPDLGAPHLLPLLALWLAREGRPVLVHRPAGENPAAATGLVLQHLGIAEAQDAEDVADRWARREPALVSSALLTTPGRCPGAWRLAVPAGPRVALPLVACGSAGDRDSAAFAAGLSGQAWLCLLQAAEGPRGSPLAPSLAAYLGTAPMAGPALGLPTDPMERWGATTRGGGPAAAALFAQDVLSGARPLPEPLRRLAAGVVGHLESLAETHSREP